MIIPVVLTEFFICLDVNSPDPENNDRGIFSYEDEKIEDRSLLCISEQEVKNASFGQKETMMPDRNLNSNDALVPPIDFGRLNSGLLEKPEDLMLNSDLKQKQKLNFTGDSLDQELMQQVTRYSNCSGNH